MPTPSVEQVRAWLGRSMIDSDGKQLGEITDIYLDRETDQPEWAVVRTGLFGLRSSFVPLAKAREVEHDIQVPHPRTLVKDAPNIEADGQLSEAEEAELYRHYGLDYDTVMGADSGRAAGEPGGLAPDDEPPAPPSGDNQPDSPPRRAQEEREVDDGEPPPGGDDPGSSWSAGQERFGVGEGVSRPFVYQTPASSQDRPGSRRRQPGQVRLRRYLVTEVVTETEAGQQHELRVEQEPIRDQDLDAVTATPGQPEASVQPESPAPASNDWFRPEGDPPR
jgi:sporulation protein YlmC with PRC-barrel domain